jgi:hypothetical protein
VRGYPSSKHVCSTARLTARPHALRPCARQPRGCHYKWNEHLYRSARRRPQLNPRGPAAAGHLQIRACYTSLLLAACNRTRKGAFSAGHQMRTVPMFASPVVYTRRSSALAAQLRRKYFGTRQFSSRDLAVQHDEHHPCWKAAHFLPCTRPPDVLRMHRPQRRTIFGPSARRAFVATTSGFHTMPYGGLCDDEDTAAGASFGTVRHPSPLVSHFKSRRQPSWKPPLRASHLSRGS